MIEDMKYKIEFKKQTNWIFAIFLGLFIIILIAILATIIYGLITTPSRIQDFAFIVIIMILIGLVILDRFLWQIKGVELLLITDKLILIKKGKLYKSTKQIDFNEYESISYDKDNQTSIIAKLYGLKGGNIRINYLGRQTRFGQDISLKLAEIVTKEIDNEIKKIINNYA
jgi:hypothetical protein